MDMILGLITNQLVENHMKYSASLTRILFVSGLTVIGVGSALLFVPAELSTTVTAGNVIQAAIPDWSEGLLSLLFLLRRRFALATTWSRHGIFGSSCSRRLGQVSGGRS